MVDNGRAEGYERHVPHGAFLVKRGRMRVAQRSIPALLFLASGAVAASCGGDDFCSKGSYECTGGTAPATSGGAGLGGTSGDGLGGSTGSSGSATAGFPSMGGTSGNAGNSEGGAPATGGTGGISPTGGTTGTSGEAGNSGEGGEGGHGPTSCDTDNPTAGCVLTTGLTAIYVAPPSAGGDDGNDGTQFFPVATLGRALELPGANVVPIFVCAGTYKEHVEVTVGGVTLHGSYTCDAHTWTYDPTATSRVAPTSKDEALRVKDVTGLTMTDMELVSANADTKTPGASSVAVFVSGSTEVAFVRDHIVAGDGVRGADGVLEPFTYADISDLAGSDADTDTGAAAKDCKCDASSEHTRGARGGDGGQDGGTGTPADLGGGAPGTHGSPCSNGGLGSDAPIVADAPGAGVSGSLAEAGWTPASGSDGVSGRPGQGGGGGGGGKNAGDGGGGGGACGGCGGKGGGAGGGGGASIAVLALDSKLAITASKLEAGVGGDGGVGAQGQLGQDGGSHGNGWNNACQGGAGGKGAAGGAGGGGAGGISVGIGWSTTSTISVEETTVTPGTPGAGGHGAGSDNNGLAGVAEEQLEL